MCHRLAGRSRKARLFGPLIQAFYAFDASAVDAIEGRGDHTPDEGLDGVPQWVLNAPRRHRSQRVAVKGSGISYAPAFLAGGNWLVMGTLHTWRLASARPQPICVETI